MKCFQLVWHPSLTVNICQRNNRFHCHCACGCGWNNLFAIWLNLFCLPFHCICRWGPASQVVSCPAKTGPAIKDSPKFESFRKLMLLTGLQRPGWQCGLPDQCVHSSGEGGSYWFVFLLNIYCFVKWLFVCLFFFFLFCHLNSSSRGESNIQQGV